MPASKPSYLQEKKKIIRKKRKQKGKNLEKKGETGTQGGGKRYPEEQKVTETRRHDRNENKAKQTASQLREVTPPNQRRGQQPYWVPNATESCRRTSNAA